MKKPYHIYSLLRLYKKIKSPKLKIVGLMGSSAMGLRHLSLRVDPASSCNLFCLMCYFSDSEIRKQRKGQISVEEMHQIAKIFFSKAFQLVIGCGAEPTLNREFMELFKLAKDYKVPNLSIVSNGQLLRESHIKEMIQYGVDEIILSTHGLSKINYEKFMVNGKYDQFIYLLELINRLKKESNSSKPQIRLNYTVNEENLDDLKTFDVFSENFVFDTIQIRPIMDIGGKYNKVLPKGKQKEYLEILSSIKEKCDQKKIILLANTNDITHEQKNKDGVVIESVYTYISKKTIDELQLNSKTSTLKRYKNKIGWNNKLFNALFNHYEANSSVDKNLKYDVL